MRGSCSLMTFESRPLTDLDSDTIALHNLDHLFSHPLVDSAHVPYVAAPDWGRWSRPPSPKANGGVVFVRPSASLFQCMLRELKAVRAKDYTNLEAEQGFWRYFFGDEATGLSYLWNTQVREKLPLPSTTFHRLALHPLAISLCLTYLWNTQKPNRKWNPQLWNLSKTAVLHYTGTKPHVAWSRPAFLRAHRDGKTRQAAG